MVCVWGREVKGGVYETPWKRLAHHRHEKAAPGARLDGFSEILWVLSLRFFSRGGDQACCFMGMERMGSLLKTVISIFAACAIHGVVGASFLLVTL